MAGRGTTQRLKEEAAGVDKKNVPTGSGSGTVTTKKTTSSKEVKGLQVTRARVEDPEWTDGRADVVETNFRKYEDTSRWEIKEQKDNGNLVVYDTKTGDTKTYPSNKLAGSRDYLDSYNRKKVINKQSDKAYVQKVRNGYNPPDSVKGKDFAVIDKGTTTTKEVKNVGTSGPPGTDSGVEQAQEKNSTEGVDGHYVDTAEDNSSETLEDVKNDHTRTKVMTSPEVDPVDGSPVEGTGGYQYLTDGEIDQLKSEGRIKSSLARKAKQRLKTQQKLYEKDNWPVPEGYSFDSDGNIYPNDQISQGSNIAKDPNGANWYIPYANEPEPDIKTQIANSLKAPRIAKGIAGVPGEHKIKIYTKDPSNLTGTLEPLLKTGNGVIFPFTPTIQVNHSASYGTYDINQSVNQPHYYMMTPNVQINLTAIFTANTAKEASYMLAAMHFFRWATKSDFGAYENQVRRTDAGTPPPVLVFSGYGTEQFNNIPVVLRNFSYTLPEDVDYVTVQTQEAQIISRDIDMTNIDALGNEIGNELQTQDNAGAGIEPNWENVTKAFPNESTTIPSTMLFAIDIAPQYPPSQLRDEWNLKEYASGELLRKGYI